MIYKFTLIGECIVYAHSYSVKHNPGISDVIISLTDSIWTGYIHLEIIDNSSHILVSISDITKIETRSDLCESNEEWKLFFKTKKNKTCDYDYWRNKEKELING